LIILSSFIRTDRSARPFATAQTRNYSPESSIQNPNPEAIHRNDDKPKRNNGPTIFQSFFCTSKNWIPMFTEPNSHVPILQNQDWIPTDDLLSNSSPSNADRAHIFELKFSSVDLKQPVYFRGSGVRSSSPDPPKVRAG
jgi:hypothetical protein